MPAKQIKHVSVPLELSAVFREKTGVDVLDAPSVQMIIAEHVAKQLNLKEVKKVPNRFWARIVFVVDVIQQTVSLDGKGRFDIPDIDAPAEDIIDFYKFMTSPEISEEQIIFFQTGLRKFDAAPLENGASSGKPLVGAPAQDSLVTIAN